MNSVWLEWAINTKHLGSWHLKGKEVIYAHAIRYLNTALDFVRKREEEERRLISALDTSICENPEWTLLLSDWKYMMSRDDSKRTVRRMTEFRQKGLFSGSRKERLDERTSAGRRKAKVKNRKSSISYPRPPNCRVAFFLSHFLTDEVQPYCANR